MTEEKLDFKHKNKINQICDNYANSSSSHSFVSLYIWRDIFGSSLCIGNEMFSLKCDTKGENAWFFPCGDEKEKIEFIDSKKSEEKFSLCYIREEDLEFIKKYYPNDFIIEECPQDSEYIYDREAWERLEGRKYAAMRNHIRRAIKDNNLSVKIITEEDLDNVYNIISVWDRVKRMEGSNGDTDKLSAKTLIKNYRDLSVFGIMVYVDDIPFAVVAGYPLSDNMFDMCLAKQKSTLSGLSVYAKHQFITLLDKRYKYINAEEDLGIEGLRIMKQQMQPIGQIKMYDGRFIGNE